MPGDVAPRQDERPSPASASGKRPMPRRRCWRGEASGRSSNRGGGEQELSGAEVTRLRLSCLLHRMARKFFLTSCMAKWLSLEQTRRAQRAALLASQPCDKMPCVSSQLLSDVSCRLPEEQVAPAAGSRRPCVVDMALEDRDEEGLDHSHHGEEEARENFRVDCLDPGAATRAKAVKVMSVLACYK